MFFKFVLNIFQSNGQTKIEQRGWFNSCTRSFSCFDGNCILYLFDCLFVEISQLTGLKENAFESGNKDIYEGDVIEFINGERLVVEWNDDTCQFQYSDGTPINNGERYGTHKMIVGNIYESPELLK